jgi:hypothetical protein
MTRRADMLTPDLFGAAPVSAPPKQPPSQPIQPQPTAREQQRRAQIREARTRAAAVVPPATAHAAPPRAPVQAAQAAPPAVNNLEFIPDSPARLPPRIPLVLFIGAAIGLGCFVMSLYNTFTFLVAAGKPFSIALATAALTTGFSAVAFSLPQRRVLFFPLALLIIGFSIFCTIAVSYEQLKARDLANRAAADFVSQTESLRALNAREVDGVTADIQRLDAEHAGVRTAAAYWQDKSWRRYDDAQRESADLERRISLLQERKIALLQEARQLLNRAVGVEQTRAQTIYAFIHGVARIDEALVRFIIFCIPAVFFDIASPLLIGLMFSFLKTRSGE